MEKILNLEEFGGGALAEQINSELQKVINNIADPNTKATQMRKLNLTITFKPNESRNLSQVNISAKSTLATAVPFETNIFIDKDLKTGQVLASEIGNKLPGQVEMDLDSSNNANVIDLKKANAK